MRTVLVSIIFSVILTSVTACGFIGFPGVYRINVEQGNIIDQEKVNQLKIGMSRRQVRFVLGTPLVEDSFNPDRWDYVHTIRNGTDVLLDKRLTVHFEGDMLASIDGDYQPEDEKDESSDAESEPDSEPKSALAEELGGN